MGFFDRWTKTTPKPFGQIFKDGFGGKGWSTSKKSTNWGKIAEDAGKAAGASAIAGGIKSEKDRSDKNL